ncbi:MAG: hypothetical protein JO345_21945 [Streptosporangiaceae bacterium]|nr:hypothetical protein [Streptosporangiaceae bacterium]
MSLKNQATKKRIIDPAQAANEAILAERQKRIEANRKPVPDLGLGLEETPVSTAAEFLADEFDKKAFGAPAETVRRLVYGPDPLFDQCPGLRSMIEKTGLHDYAAATTRAIREKGAMAVADGVLRQGLQKAISKFGVDKVAEAFAERILKIPCREVEYEMDRDVDVEVAGSRVLNDAVDRYGRPGMSYKFLSQRCCDVLGLRGYQIVKDEKGDPVKVGTLMLGEIPQGIAERRRAYYEKQSTDAIAQEVEKYQDEAERLAHNSGHRGVGPLRASDIITANATENEGFLGQSRPAGFSIEEVTT